MIRPRPPSVCRTVPGEYFKYVTITWNHEKEKNRMYIKEAIEAVRRGEDVRVRQGLTFAGEHLKVEHDHVPSLGIRTRRTRSLRTEHLTCDAFCIYEEPSFDFAEARRRMAEGKLVMSHRGYKISDENNGAQVVCFSEIDGQWTEVRS